MMGRKKGMLTSRRFFSAALAALGLGLVLAAPAGAADPTKLKVAVILSATEETPWEKSTMNSWRRVAAAKPHGLDIELNVSESVFDNAEQVFRTYAETGEYDIIFGNTTYADAIEKVMKDYPDTMFVMSGSGNRGLGKNAYWIFLHGHEPAYLLGMLAGKLTRSNTVGVVSTIPAEDTNDQINAFKQGAKDVNPGVKTKITFIQSWYDPPKQQEATAAQIAAGADFIYQMQGAFEICEQKGIGCFGNYVDLSRLAPRSVVSSAIINWDPEIDWLIDQWWEHKTKGTPYAAPTEPVWFGMAKGGADLAGISESWKSKVPADLVALVDATRAKIVSGEKTIELNLKEPASD
jgi:basic membrane lipoprotein Med (substrate-binding protein (PBP1-ABC) superfamily)